MYKRCIGKICAIILNAFMCFVSSLKSLLVVSYPCQYSVFNQLWQITYPMLPSVLLLQRSGTLHFRWWHSGKPFFAHKAYCGLENWLLRVVSPFSVVCLWFKGLKVFGSAEVFMKVSCCRVITWKEMQQVFAFKRSVTWTFACFVGL